MIKVCELKLHRDSLVQMATPDGRVIHMKITKSIEDCAAIEVLPRCRYKIPITPTRYSATWLPIHVFDHGIQCHPLLDEDGTCKFVIVVNHSDKPVRFGDGAHMFVAAP